MQGVGLCMGDVVEAPQALTTTLILAERRLIRTINRKMIQAVLVPLPGRRLLWAHRLLWDRRRSLAISPAVMLQTLPTTAWFPSRKQSRQGILLIHHLIAVLWEAHRVQRAMALWPAAHKAHRAWPKVIQRR